MFKVRKLDFVIYDNGSERVIFRFYPRQSSCHSFDENLPKSWDDVYKVYYAYAIIHQHQFYGDKDWKSKVVFKCSCDECSRIDEVGFALKDLAKGITYREVDFDDDIFHIKYLDRPIAPFGYGVSWTIRRSEYTDDLYFLELWGPMNTGYKFALDKTQLMPFGNYLLECCEYMLAHGDPI